jgi:hypothetical protein
MHEAEHGKRCNWRHERQGEEDKVDWAKGSGKGRIERACYAHWALLVGGVGRQRL